MSGLIDVVYNTTNEFKRTEAEYIFSTLDVEGSPIRDKFKLRFTEARVKEALEIDIEEMVRGEVLSAYTSLKIPCIVEHAGLIFADRREAGFPGGLTKPMWNALGANFLVETHAVGRLAIARAVVAYCDGQDIYTFVGETEGTIVEPQHDGGEHDFYWDTVFVPRDGNPEEKTYAGLVAEDGLGTKMAISQSTAAIVAFLNFRARNRPRLWDITF